MTPGCWVQVVASVYLPFQVLNQIAEAEKENIALVDGKDTSKQKRDQAVRRRSKFQSKSKEMSIQ